ncbi:MAG: sulfotransferase domain-containing protein [Bacteroidota bacterium]
MKQQGYLPNLLVIGAMKCGTTSLHEYLNQHPDIFMSEKKEINFFVEEMDWGKGVEWYKSHFPTRSIIRGESSQNYSKAHMHAGVPDRIHRMIPDVKLLYVVRDPIARLHSHYFENIFGDQAPEDLNQSLRDFRQHHYVRTSSYFQQLSAFLPFFPKDQILVVETEAMKRDRLAVMNEIFRFLQVAELPDDSVFDFEANTRATKKRPTALAKFIRSSASASLRKIMPTALKQKIKGQDWMQKMQYTQIEATISQTKLDPALADKIRNHLGEDMAALRKWTGKKFSDWSC